jgi:hypothetical protein
VHAIVVIMEGGFEEGAAAVGGRARWRVPGADRHFRQTRELRRAFASRRRPGRREQQSARRQNASLISTLGAVGIGRVGSPAR